MCSANAMQVSHRIPGPDGGWDYASFDSEGNRLLIARSTSVEGIDIGTGKVTELLPAERGHAAFVMPGTGLGLSTNGTANTATLWNARTGAIKATIPTGQKPDAAIYDSSTRLAYVMNGRDGTVTLIDPKTMKAVGTIAVGGALEFAAVDGRGTLYVNVEDKAEIAAIDVRARRVTRRVKLTACEGPSGLALTRQGTLIASCGNGVAKLVEASNFRQLPDVPIGLGPDAVLYDSEHDRAPKPLARSKPCPPSVVRALARSILRPATFICPPRGTARSSPGRSVRRPFRVRSKCSSSPNKSVSPARNRCVGPPVTLRPGCSPRTGQW